MFKGLAELLLLVDSFFSDCAVAATATPLTSRNMSSSFFNVSVLLQGKYKGSKKLRCRKCVFYCAVFAPSHLQPAASLNGALGSRNGKKKRKRAGDLWVTINK
jgi:hypothetical protein